MKLKLQTIMLAFFAIAVFSSCVAHTHTTTTRVVHQPAPRTVTVNTWSHDISNNLDLRAVISVFATSRSLWEFEMRLNDPRLGISNLDLNRDGFVDYIRAVEVFDRRTPNTRIVVLQAVLGFNVFQDVATIVVEGRNSRNATMYIIGDPWLFGRNYIIAPMFHHPPVIFGSFWGPSHVVWRSPYHWGHFPPTFHNRPIVITNVYINNIYVNNVVNVNTRFNYRPTVRSQQSVNRMMNEVSRNDFSRTHPNESFTNRNTGVSNTRELQTRDQNAAATRQPATQQQQGTRQQATQQQPATRQPATQQQQQQTQQRQPATQQQQQQTQQRQPATQQQQQQGTRQEGAQQGTEQQQRQPTTQQQQQTQQRQPATQQQQQTQQRQQPAAQQQTQQRQQPAAQQQTTNRRTQAAQQQQTNTRQTNTETNQGNRR